ncbi:MAG: GNAT family N-acetyltransferase [Candidatus Heteroscillospira sp.]|jgi:putative acetyltransferase
MTIRSYRSADCAELVELFFNTVHTVNAADYTEQQLNAWAPGEVELAQWDASLGGHYSLVALIDDTIAGFGDIDETGYLDRLYVHKDFQRRGVASALCDRLEQTADKITTHASLTARRFFEKRGYAVVKEQQVLRRGVYLTNFIMEKNNKNST